MTQRSQIIILKTSVVFTAYYQRRQSLWFRGVLPEIFQKLLEKKKKIWYTTTVALIFIGPWRSWTLHHILYCVEWTLPLQVSQCRKCRIRTRDGLSIAVRRARNSSPPLLFHFIFPVRFSPSQSSGWASGWWPMLPPLWDSSTRWAIQFKGIVAWNHKLTRKIDQQSTL